MFKYQSQNMVRTNDEKDVRSAERPRCAELSAFELELIAGGGSPLSDRNAMLVAKR